MYLFHKYRFPDRALNSISYTPTRTFSVFRYHLSRLYYTFLHLIYKYFFSTLQRVIFISRVPSTLNFLLKRQEKLPQNCKWKTRRRGSYYLTDYRRPDTDIILFLDICHRIKNIKIFFLKFSKLLYIRLFVTKVLSRKYSIQLLPWRMWQEKTDNKND